jgi:ATP-binding cassette subfamily B protein RaxB
VRSWQLLGVASGFKGTIAQILLLSVALEVFALAMPFFLQLTVDRVLVGRDRDLLTVLGVAFAALVVIQVAVTAVRAWVGVYLSTNINLRLLTNLFNHMLRLPLGWFEKRNVGDIVGKFRSVDAIQKTLSTTFVETAVDGVMVVLTLLVMLYYSVTLTSVVVGAALLYGFLRWVFFYPQRYATDEQLAHEARSGTHFIETLRGMMAIKLNLREAERPLGLPEPGGGPDQRRRAGPERGHPAARLERAHLRAGRRGGDLARGAGRDGREVHRRDALRVPRIQDAVPHAGDQPHREVE